MSKGGMRSGRIIAKSSDNTLHESKIFELKEKNGKQSADQVKSSPKVSSNKPESSTDESESDLEQTSRSQSRKKKVMRKKRSTSWGTRASSVVKNPKNLNVEEPTDKLILLSPRIIKR